LPEVLPTSWERCENRFSFECSCGRSRGYMRICGRCGYDWALEDLREWESRWRLREIFFAVWAMERRQEGSRRLRQPRTVDSVAVISNKQRTWRSDRRRNTLCGATVHLHVSYQPSPQYKLPAYRPTYTQAYRNPPTSPASSLFRSV